MYEVWVCRKYDTVTHFPESFFEGLFKYYFSTGHVLSKKIEITPHIHIRNLEEQTALGRVT